MFFEQNGVGAQRLSGPQSIAKVLDIFYAFEQQQEGPARSISLRLLIAGRKTYRNGLLFALGQGVLVALDVTALADKNQFDVPFPCFQGREY